MELIIGSGTNLWKLRGEKIDITTYISVEASELAVKNNFPIKILHNLNVMNPYWCNYLHDNPLNFFKQAKPCDLINYVVGTENLISKSEMKLRQQWG